jgi:hypothetical protein
VEALFNQEDEKVGEYCKQHAKVQLGALQRSEDALARVIPLIPQEVPSTGTK